MTLSSISPLLFLLLQSSFLPSATGFESEKKIGVDEVYKARKWSQVRDGPYRMVVSSRDRSSDESPFHSENTKRNRQAYADEDKDTKTEDVGRELLDTAIAIQVEDDKQVLSAGQGIPLHDSSQTDGKVITYRSGERRKHKVKLELIDKPSPIPDDSEKSTQRTLKLGRKRERILLDENFRKAHRVSIPEGYFSTSKPSTLSYKVYNHFRPIDRGIPRESIIPFYDFGKKLSTGKTPSGINSIEGSSTPGLSGYEMTTHREDQQFRYDNVPELKELDKTIALRSWTDTRSPELPMHFQTTLASMSDDDIKTETTSLPSEEETKAYTITTQPVPSTPPSTDSTTTILPTILLPDQPDSQPDSNFKKETIPKTKNHVSSAGIPTTDFPNPVDLIPVDKNQTLERREESSTYTENITESSQHLQPSPTAKILSTAVVTSVSVKETYRHPRIKEVNESDAVTIFQNKSSLGLSPLKLQLRGNITAGISSINQGSKEGSGTIGASKEHSQTLDKQTNQRIIPLYKNNTINTTTIHPKFKSNIELHTFPTKIPFPVTTQKPVNRSLYSTVQREQQTNKFVFFQHNRSDNNTKSFASVDAQNSSFPPPESKVLLPTHDNKTKMYLTIRSRVPNQSATFRSTYRRNSTKTAPPVLRVIATPSSYIEVPRIISRLQHNSLTTTVEPPVHIDPSKPIEEHSDSSTKLPSYRSYDQPKEITTKIIPLLKTPDNMRETRMNNHRMPTDEPTTEEEKIAEMTTLYFFHPLETTTETIKNFHDTGTNIASVPHQKPGASKPGLAWINLGQKNRSRHHESAVELAYANGFGIAAYVLATLGIIPLIIGGLVLLRQIFIKSKKKMLDESEYSSEYNRTPLPAKLPRIPASQPTQNWEGERGAGSTSPCQQGPTMANPLRLQHDPPVLDHNPEDRQHRPNWEFPRDKLRLQTLLGEGNFGQVWKAEADDISGHEGLTRLVAVKTVKEASGERERDDLLRELAIMQELGSHPNVVTLLGCCTDREPFLLIMEYVMYGKMLTFLREHRTRAHYFNFSDLNSALVSRDLTVFAYCVSRGMEYLVTKGIIHRDLAARNILVDHNKLCKIADFGMSRNVHDSGEIYEQRPNRGALPIRWMAPEALHCSIFTHKSDVWSFGILVWEIITLGCTPYQSMGAREVMRKVREGYRLDRPAHCSQDLYKVVTRCWAADPSKRPSFSDLKHDLGTLLSDPQTNGACVDLDALTEEMSSHSC